MDKFAENDAVNAPSVSSAQTATGNSPKKASIPIEQPMVHREPVLSRSPLTTPDTSEKKRKRPSILRSRRKL